MSVGLLALLDDVAAIAKVAAASLDDITAQALKAGTKAAGAVIDDAAVTPRYVHGFSAERELPIVGRIALGSIRNKVIILLPAALLLSFFVPWLIDPLLMIGGAYLCYEGAEKIYGKLFSHEAPGHEAMVEAAAARDAAQDVAQDAALLEKERVSGAIKTDFILSAEIMAIALATLPAGDWVSQALVLLVVAIGITAAVYGGVALIVKADDIGLHLASTARAGLSRALGRGLVTGMPRFMGVLTTVGTAAMLWVGGGILVHGLASLGIVGPEHGIAAAARFVATLIPLAPAVFGWLTTAILSGVVGLVVGFALIPVVHYAIGPLFALFRRDQTKRFQEKL